MELKWALGFLTKYPMSILIFHSLLLFHSDNVPSPAAAKSLSEEREGYYRKILDENKTRKRSSLRRFCGAGAGILHFNIF